jgi:pimeloyl-ACP methyl ester carboxylesterase
MTQSDNPLSVVLVHGGFVDGSGWQPVYRLLRNEGYAVAVVQQPRCPSTVMSRPRGSSSMPRMDPSSSWDTPTGER